MRHGTVEVKGLKWRLLKLGEILIKGCRSWGSIMADALDGDMEMTIVNRVVNQPFVH
jgi:hypothetical protein